jgi:hypothetical protein
MTAPRLELLTELGRALGCVSTLPAAVESARPRANSGFPDRCYYAGPFDAAPRRRPQISLAPPATFMEREASELRRRADEDLMRFFQKMALRKKRRTIDSPDAAELS